MSLPERRELRSDQPEAEPGFYCKFLFTYGCLSKGFAVARSESRRPLTSVQLPWHGSESPDAGNGPPAYSLSTSEMPLSIQSLTAASRRSAWYGYINSAGIS
eukprot:g64460.t1